METSIMDIQVERMFRFETEGSLKAFADIIVNGALLIKGVRIVDGKKGLFVSMPREKSKNDQWYDSVRCLTKEIREQITEVVLAAYETE